MLLLAVVAGVLLRRTTLGATSTPWAPTRRPRGSRASTSTVVMFAYIASGALAGLTGCVLMSRASSAAQPNEGVM